MPRHRFNDITRPLRFSVRHILDDAANADRVHLGLAPGERVHEACHRARATHVVLHGVHSRTRFKRDAARVEGHAFADKCNGLRIAVPRAFPLHHQQLRLAFRSQANAQQTVHTKLGHFLFAQHLNIDAHVFQRPSTFGKLFWVKHIGRLGDQVACIKNALRNRLGRPPCFFRFANIACDNVNFGKRRLVSFLLRGSILVEPIAAQDGAQSNASCNRSIVVSHLPGRILKQQSD